MTAWAVGKTIRADIGGETIEMGSTSSSSVGDAEGVATDS